MTSRTKVVLYGCLTATLLARLPAVAAETGPAPENPARAGLLKGEDEKTPPAPRQEQREAPAQSTAAAPLPVAAGDQQATTVAPAREQAVPQQQKPVQAGRREKTTAPGKADVAGVGSREQSVPKSEPRAPQAAPSSKPVPEGKIPGKNPAVEPKPDDAAPARQKGELQTPRIVGAPPESPEDKKAPPVAPIFDQPGVMTPSRTIVLEPSLQYLNSSSNRVALSGYTVIPSLTIGLIDVRNVNSNTYVASVATRYGITSRIEAEMRLPYVYRSDSTASQPANTEGQSTPASVFVADGHDVGDIDFGVRYQLNRPDQAEGPYFIVGVRAKAPTGTSPFDVATDPTIKGPDGQPLQTELPTGSGFWAFQPSLTALFSSDPVAFFGSISYMWNVERTYGGASYDPGDTIGFNFGTGVALNEKTSISLGYDHLVLGKTKRNGLDLPGTMVTQIGTLLIGGSYRFDERTSVSLSLGIGATPAASNVQLTLRVPLTFSLAGKKGK